jgi:hypothetical protein
MIAMRRLQHTVIVALGCTLFPYAHADAQVVIEPASPRWGESITIAVEPNPSGVLYTKERLTLENDCSAVATIADPASQPAGTVRCATNRPPSHVMGVHVHQTPSQLSEGGLRWRASS